MTDIITLLYGDRKDLDQLITSIETHCTDYNLIVIDNNELNRGFTKATNEGISQGTAPYIWLLNQDAIVLKGAQEALIQRLLLDETCGIAGSMQVDIDNPNLIRHGGTQRAFPGGSHKGGYLSMGHCQIPEKQTWVNFASVMLRRAMVDKIGLLDESMFLLYSDSDYCYVARQNGWSVWYEPNSRVVHRLNASKNITEWHRKDMEAFMKKWEIVPDPIQPNGFRYGRTFAKLDMFP
jgi:GT2 family glycosyltransferase